MIYIIYLHSTFHLISISHISIYIASLQQIDEMLFVARSVALKERQHNNKEENEKKMMKNDDSPCCAAVMMLCQKLLPK